MVIDNPISFAEVNRAINKLKKGKAPGTKTIPCSPTDHVCGE
jgi:hypothetical protein